MPQPITQMSDLEIVESFAATRKAIEAQLRKIIVGQGEIIDHLLTAVLAAGHCLHRSACRGWRRPSSSRRWRRRLDLKFSRIQFTPDLMPADITGTEIIEQDMPRARRFRASSRGRSSRTSSSPTRSTGRRPRRSRRCSRRCRSTRSRWPARRTTLELPFFVLATQNPIEQEGTYPLPEAQLDRFMFSLNIDYPTREEEIDRHRVHDGKDRVRD